MSETALATECRERATYLRAMEPEGLSTIERQSMETLFKAADNIDRLTATLEHILNGALSLPRFAEEEGRKAIALARGEPA